MNLISMENIYKSFSEKPLIENISLGIDDKDKIGLIGVNGTGKTSLLKIIAGLIEPDDGKITKKNNINIEYLPQDIDFQGDLTVIEQVFKGNSDNIKLVRRYRQALNKEDIDNEQIMKLTEEMDRKDAWALESEAKAILTKLGIYNFKEKIGKLSGGQKKRIALAQALINPSDLLILDEPTNHLDNTTIEWLEEYLKIRKGALIMITHDRYFLDKISNQIIEIERGNIHIYEGNYNYYLEKKAERQEREAGTERKTKSILRKELAWMKQGAKARSTKQKARIDRFNELSSREFNHGKDELDISVAGTRLGKKIIEVIEIEKSFKDKKIIDNFSFTLLRDDRIGILGDNGSGKSTLLNIIAGKIEPDKGFIDIGKTVNIGYFTQATEEMNDETRAIEYIREYREFIETKDGEKISASQMMERFLFPPSEQWTPIGKLSGGEKRRLYLLKVLMNAPNILVLDEPTNDLDIDTLTILEDYIDEFKGAVIVVSHDRYLLNRVVDRVFVFEGDGKIDEYTGNYDYFKEQKFIEIDLKQEKQNKIKDSKNQKSQRNKNQSFKFSYNEQREWEMIDEEIEELEKIIGNIENKTLEYAADYEKLQELIEEKSKIELQLENKMERWLYLSELDEKIKNENK